MKTSLEGLDSHEWRAIIDYGGAWTGKVLVQLGSAVEITTLHQRLNGHGVRVQQHVAGVEVESLYIDLDSGPSARQHNSL